jgi:hypothetical protein
MMMMMMMMMITDDYGIRGRERERNFLDPCADAYVYVKSVDTHVDKSRRWWWW